jgi:hypothetical protein
MNPFVRAVKVKIEKIFPVFKHYLNLIPSYLSLAERPIVITGTRLNLG